MLVIIWMLSDYDRSQPLSLSYKDNNFVPYTLNQSSWVIQLDSFSGFGFNPLCMKLTNFMSLALLKMEWAEEPRVPKQIRKAHLSHGLQSQPRDYCTLSHILSFLPYLLFQFLFLRAVSMQYNETYMWLAPTFIRANMEID